MISLLPEIDLTVATGISKSGEGKVRFCVTITDSRFPRPFLPGIPASGNR